MPKLNKKEKYIEQRLLDLLYGNHGSVNSDFELCYSDVEESLELVCVISAEDWIRWVLTIENVFSIKIKDIHALNHFIYVDTAAKYVAERMES